MALLFGASLALALHFGALGVLGLAMGRGFREFAKNLVLSLVLFFLAASVTCAKTLFFLPATEFDAQYRERQLASFISEGLNLGALFSVLAMGFVLYSLRKRPLSGLPPTPAH